MSAPRRVIGFLVVAGLATASLSCLANPAPGQQALIPPGFRLPTDNRLRSTFDAVEDYIKDEAWQEATKALQRLLDLKEDRFVADRVRKVWVSARAEAERLVGSLPPKGMEFYRLTYGPTAAELLKQARRDKDATLLAQVVTRFLYTDAGPEALDELAFLHAGAGRFASAALAYERLLRHRGLARWQPVSLYHATRAFRQAGNREKADLTRKELLARIEKTGLRLGDRTLSAAEVEKELDKIPDEKPGDDWPAYRGDARRSDRGSGGVPFLVPTWKRRTYEGSTGESDATVTTQVKAWIDQTEAYLKDHLQPSLPSSFPVMATVTTKDGKKRSLLVYRSYWGVHAVDPMDGELLWQTRSNWSPAKMAQDSDKMQAIRQWMNYYVGPNGKPTILFDNSTVGSLSADDFAAYWVEDLAVPPPPRLNNQFVNPGATWGPKVNQAIQASKLMAQDLATGKVRWEMGGLSPEPSSRKLVPEEIAALNDSLFLGPPLPLQGELYVLVQKKATIARDHPAAFLFACPALKAAPINVPAIAIRLARIDPKRGAVLSVKTLATLEDPSERLPFRRIQAHHLAAGGGVLVCPTHAGLVLGVDLLTQELLWVFDYRDPKELPEFNPKLRGLPAGWVLGPDGPYNPSAFQKSAKVSAPLIQGDRVLFTAPDGDAVYSLRLADGSPRWKNKWQDDDLYLAGSAGGKVLIVGKQSVRAIDLAKGESLWTLPTGLPSGEGVFSGNVYYLPLKEAGRDKQPEICAIDVAKGQIVAHVRSRKHGVPGNLLFFADMIVSQTPDAVTVFPELRARLAEVDAQLAKNPNDPTALVLRARLRLDKGDLQGGIEDLRAASKNKPTKPVEEQAWALLYEALTEMFQRDFSAAEKAGYLPEYEALARRELPRTPGPNPAELKAEEGRRRANYFFLLGKGREAQGRLLDALKAYLALGALGPGDEMLSPVDEPAVKVRRDVWVRGRIGDLLKKATLEQRKQLEEEIGRQWKDVQGAKDLDPLRSFAATFGVTSALGRQARLLLAERLIEADQFAEVEQKLLELRRQTDDPTSAAKALDALARLATKRGLLADAVHYYRVLGRDFATVKVRDDKTGLDLFNDLSTDRRFFSHLGEPQRFPAGNVHVTVENGNFPMNAQIYKLAHFGEVLPFFDQHRLAFNFNFHRLEITEKATGKETWSQALTRTMVQQIAFANGQSNVAPFAYQTLGHLVILPLGHLVFGLDPINKKVLWQKNLHANASQINKVEVGPQNYVQLTVDPRDGTLQVIYQDGWTQRLGQPLILTPSVLVLQVRDGLVGIDPVSGRTLWTRSDVSPRAYVFGDEVNVYVVEIGPGGETAKSTRALRIEDGSAVKMPDFAPLFEKRVRIQDGRLLLKESGMDESLTLRLYDVRAGKELWKQTFPAKSLMLQSEAPAFTGAVAPDGTLRVLDLSTGKEMLAGTLQSRHLDKVKAVHLMYDGQDFFLACESPTDASLMFWGGVQPNVMPGLGMRSVPVNGEVYCFDGKKGRLRWHNPVPNEMLLLDGLRDQPLLLFSASYNKLVVVGAGRNVVQVVAASAIEKASGKFRYQNENLPNQQNFHVLNVDAKNGTIELVSWQMKIRFAVTEEKKK
jgi:outer membrane protein assembly factor BamB/tetratricopeptide (TPR) repeat protein